MAKLDLVVKLPKTSMTNEYFARHLKTAHISSGYSHLLIKYDGFFLPMLSYIFQYYYSMASLFYLFIFFPMQIGFMEMHLALQLRILQT